MKQSTLLVLIAALALSFALAGCGSSTAASSSASSDQMVVVSEPSVSASAASETASALSSSSSEKSVEAQDSSKADDQKGSLPTNARDYVEALVWQNGLGELVTYKQYKDDDGDWILEVVTRGADGKEYTSLIGADGTVLENGYEKAHPATEANNDADADAADDAEVNDAEADGTDDAEADDGNDAAAGTDDDADSDDDSDVKPYSNKEAKQAVEDYDLGTYMYSQEVQGSDGNIYQEITTRDEDGNDSYSYLNSKGDVVYDVDVELRYNNDGTADPAKPEKKE